MKASAGMHASRVQI